MKSLVILFVTAVLCQIVVVGGYRNRRYFNPASYYGSSTSSDTAKRRSYGGSEETDYSSEGSDEEPSRPTDTGNSYSKGSVQGWPKPWPSNTGKPTSELTPNPSSSSLPSNEDLIATCIRSCPVTAEYNPVCGSNNVTYQNPGRLECEQNCGIVVSLSRLTACSVAEPITTTHGPIDRETLVACLRKCPLTAEFDPVCGSNNITYENPGRLICAQKCGVRVQLVKPSPCVPEPTSTETTLTKEEQIVNCMQTCPFTGGYHPVCGSNNVTYANPGRLECAQNCGADVQLVKPSPCEPELTSTEKTLTKEEQIADCMQKCPFTGGYHPVCGSNNVTYANPGRLECAQNCGIDVQLSRHTSCTAPLDEELGNDQPTMSSTGSYQVPTTSSTTLRPYVNGNGGNYFSSVSGGHSENSADGKVNDSKTNNFNVIINGNNNNSENNSNRTTSGSYGIGENSNVNIDEVSGGNLSYGEAGGNGSNIEDNNEDGANNFNEETHENDKADNFAVPKEGSSSEPKIYGNHHNNGNRHRNCNNGNSPSLSKVMECMQLCSLTSEYNPVCGSDGITYTNPGRLLCSQYCGIDVKVKKFAPCASQSVTNIPCNSPPVPTCNCGTTFTNPPVTPVTTPTPKPTCMEACTASDVFKPVCGSNNVTYRNKEVLQCARRCGVDVSLESDSECSLKPSTTRPPVWNDKNKPTTPAEIHECIKRCSVEEKYEPICGSNDVTYNNTGHLICARQCGLDARVKEIGPCSDTSSVTPTPTKDQVTPDYGGLDFTIPEHILASIWSEGTTPKDDEFDLDQRVQD